MTVTDIEETDNTDNTEETTEESEPLTWLVNKGELTIASAGREHDHVRVIATGEGDAFLSIEDAREVLTHALAHMGGGTDRADTAVAGAAMEMCFYHADMRERAEKRLAKLQEAHALQARHLGDFMGRLKKYE